MLRPCTICQVLTHNARCPEHTKQLDRDRGTAEERGYDAEHRRLSKLARKLQPWCSWCLSISDLTADHVVALKDGGLNVIENYRVLCRSCNSARRD